jgi:hypothetical protein
VPEIVYDVLRVLATGVGGVIAWFLAAPVGRGLYRLAFQRPMPAGGVVASRFIGALGVAALIYFFLPLGEPGGGGTGTGGGTGAGHGPGIADKSGTGKPGTDVASTDKGGGNAKGQLPKDGLAIEILGGTRKEKRFYLVQGKEMNLTEVDEFLTKNAGTWRKIYIVTTDNSPAEIEGTPQPATRLKDHIVSKHKMLWEAVRR